MSDSIQIQKNIIFLFAGLVLVFAVGAYIVFGSGVQTSYSQQPTAAGNGVQDIQDIYIKALRNGEYDNMQLTVKKGVPVRVHFSTEGKVGCGAQLVIYGLNVRAISRDGSEQVAEFTPQQTGTYDYSCGMYMWGPGKLVVV